MDVHLLVGHHFLKVDLVDCTKALAIRTCTLGRIEREVVGCGIAIADTGSGAHQAFGEMLNGSRFLIENEYQTFALLHGYLYRFLESLLILGRYGQLVDDHLNVVVLISIHLHATGNLHDFTINTDIQIALAAHGLKEFTIVSLTAAN